MDISRIVANRQWAAFHRPYPKSFFDLESEHFLEPIGGLLPIRNIDMNMINAV